MYKIYRTRLTDLEKLRLNLIENQDIRNSCMSILSYLIKKNKEENQKYDEAGLSNLKNPLTFKISFRKFLKLYNRSHIKISIGTLKNRIDLLIELKLIKRVDKSTYSFYRDDINDDLNKKMNNSKSDQTTDNSDVEVVEAPHKSLNTKINNNKDIDTYNSKQVAESIDNFDYVSYLEQNKKCANWDYVLTLLNKAFKSMKVRSKEIKGTVISKVYDYHTHITKKHAMSYIIKAINNARDLYYKKHNQYQFNNSNNPIDSFNNYPQRTYDFDKLEPKLLGWIK